ncbi:hypothetical protein F5H01DRAFT_127437 [Linnemannia elongata]|nr:hypothetical protein F5H01DRAFT_127437 [Linnemannia elongata]
MNLPPPPPSRSAPLFCSPFFFPLPHLSLSIVLLLVTHLLVSFLIPTFARNYPPRNLPFLTHVTTSPSSFSSPHYFFLCIIPLSLPFFVFISFLFTHHQHLFIMGINVPSFPQLLTIFTTSSILFSRPHSPPGFSLLEFFFPFILC